MELNQKETILITGATGLVGAEVLKKVLEQGAEVIGLARNLPHQGDSRVKWVACDLLDVAALDSIIEQVDKIYHCAGLVSFDPTLRHQLYKTNVEGTANLINACIGKHVKKILYLSSVAAIGEGKGKDNIITEEMVWNEDRASDYSKSKHLAEMEVWRGICEGVPAVILNPSIILGSGNWEQGSTALFKSVYEEFPWYTDGTHGFVDVEDVARVAIELMESEISSQRFIINGINCSYGYLFTAIAKAFDKKPPHKKVTKTLAEFVWRIKYIKGKLTGKPSILNKNTARTALAMTEYDGEKLRRALPEFQFQEIEQSLQRICRELTLKYEL